MAYPSVKFERARPDGTGGFVIVRDQEYLGMGCGLILAPFFIVIGLIPYIIMAFAETDFTLGEAIGAVLFSSPYLMFTAFGLYILYGIFAFKPARLRLQQSQFIRGQRMEVQFSYARRFGTLGKEGTMTAKLVCLKVDRYARAEPEFRPQGGYTGKSILTIPLETQTVPANARAFEAYWRIDLPRDAPSTDMTGNEWTVWQLEVRTSLGRQFFNGAKFVIDIV